MKQNHLFWTGIVLGIMGILFIVQATPATRLKKFAIQEGYCEVAYPSDWRTDVRKEVMELSQSGGLPEIRNYNPEEILSPDASFMVTADLQNPGKTIQIRLVFIQAAEPPDLMYVAKFQSTLNSKKPDYKLIELKELTINSQYAARRIETYRVDTDQGPDNYSLVATYFQADNGMCSVLLVDAPWSEMQAQMPVYEEIVNSFQAGK